MSHSIPSVRLKLICKGGQGQIWLKMGFATAVQGIGVAFSSSNHFALLQFSRLFSLHYGDTLLASTAGVSTVEWNACLCQ